MMMKRALPLAALLLSSTALAQVAPQPAQMGIIHGATPELLHVLDRAGMWAPMGSLDPLNHIFLDARRTISPTAFGAKCDAVQSGSTWTGTDDTAALQTWALAATTGTHMAVPGACLFSGQITFPLAFGVTVEGPGTLVYQGASTTLDPLIQIGQYNSSNGCAATGWTLRNLSIRSATKMTAGDGLVVSDGCDMEISGLAIGGNLGAINTNLFNGLHLNGGNHPHVRGYYASASNDAVRMNGDSSPLRQLTDPMLLEGRISGSLVGLHICGGVGGFEGDMSSVLGNGTNVLDDRACVAAANLQLFFGHAFAVDATDQVTYPGSPGIGFHVSDPGGNTTIITYKGWLASATNQCFVFDAGTPNNPAYPPMVNITGATIGNCHAPTASNGTGVENQSAYARITIMATNFFTSQPGRPTIYNVAGAAPISIQSLEPDANFNISGSWAGFYANAFGQLLTATPTLSAPDLVATGPGAGVQWRPQGGTQPADQKNWDMFENASTGDMTLRVVNDAYNLNNPYITYYRGAGYGLVGARTAFSVPMEAPSYTIAALPSCVPGMQGAIAVVTNGQASPPYLGPVSATGSVIAPVICNGSGWVYI
jgi:hypothetical protein